MRATVAALVAITVFAVPAAANHKKPITKTYDVTAPVPYAVDGSSHCKDAPESLSRASFPATLPDRGTFDVTLTGFVGDWVIELYDAKGRMVGQSAMFDPANPAPKRSIKYKNKAPGQQVTVMACNVTGGPTAQLRTIFTYL